ncbi:hypothetical protein E1258_08465 [Micromonospora sp. KC207]|nr:hypothetical protein E1258_08465 [Micromonospora sp. KC207]
MPASAHRVWDDSPAAGWEDAFLSGNGGYGIMVLGDPYAERVIVNHHHFVLPNGTHDAQPPRLAHLLPRPGCPARTGCRTPCTNTTW